MTMVTFARRQQRLSCLPSRLAVFFPVKSEMISIAGVGHEQTRTNLTEIRPPYTFIRICIWYEVYVECRYKQFVDARMMLPSTYVRGGERASPLDQLSELDCSTTKGWVAERARNFYSTESPPRDVFKDHVYIQSSVFAQQALRSNRALKIGHEGTRRGCLFTVSVPLYYYTPVKPHPFYMDTPSGKDTG